MKDDLPPDSAALPDARAARPALALQQRVGEEVDTGGQLAAVEIVRSPGVLHRLIETRRNRFQDVLAAVAAPRSEEHTSELQSRRDLVCRLLLEKKKKKKRK